MVAARSEPEVVRAIEGHDRDAPSRVEIDPWCCAETIRAQPLACSNLNREVQVKARQRGGRRQAERCCFVIDDDDREGQAVKGLALESVGGLER
jgi:hypothetical protein